MAVADLSQAAARTRKPEPAKDSAPEVISVETAFLVYKRKDTGQIVLSPDLNAAVMADRPPTGNDVYMFLQVLLKDIVGEQYGAMAAQTLLAMQAQMQQAVQSMGGREGIDKIMRDLKK